MRPFPLLPAVFVLCSLLSVPSQGQNFHCKPCFHGFGQVEVGDSSSTSIELINNTDNNVRLRSESHQGSAFTFTNLQLPMTLASGSSVTVNVVFSPTATGETHGSFTIVSNDEAASPLTVEVAGLGVSSGPTTSQLSVSPATLSFGNVSVGNSSSLSATLTASGGSVTIDSDSTNSSEFSITGLTLPVTVHAGSSVQATITFKPNASGTASAKAGFISNAPGSPTIEELSGTGVTASSHSADLTWDAGASGIVGYNIYRGTTHGGPYSQLNSSLLSETNYTDTSVDGGTTYYYVATEVNNEGEESAYSNEAKAVIPGN